MSKNVQRSAGRPIDRAKDRAILAAGRSLLFGAGPEAVTMEAVAREAGVAKPTLYRRFANRDALIAAVAEAEADRMASSFRMRPGDAEDLRRALIDFACDLTRFLLSAEHLDYLQALGASTGLAQSTRDSIFEHGPKGTHRRLANWLARADEEELLHCPDPDDSAEVFLGMLMGLDVVRSLYRVPRLHDANGLETRVARRVDAFLLLHAPG